MSSTTDYCLSHGARGHTKVRPKLHWFALSLYLLQSWLYNIYTVIHNYGNPYEKWNIFVAWPHLWLKLCMVKPEIMLCETVLNLSTLRYVTAQYPVT